MMGEIIELEVTAQGSDYGDDLFSDASRVETGFTLGG